MKKYELKNIDIVNTSFLIAMPILSVVFISIHLMNEHLSWGAISVGFLFYLLTGFSITVGYHRLFSHRSFKTNKFIKLFFLIFGAAAFQNSLLKWASDHRRHHSKVDTKNDPYNINEGFFFAHMGWVMLKRDNPIENVNDLKADPLVMWQHENYLLICSFFGILLPALLGWYFGTLWAGLGIAAFARVTIVHHVTFFINSLCHYFGKQTYSDTHTAKDSVIMALLTFGEGYHNFHHEFQLDYRNGIKWYHFDPSKWIIFALSKLQLAWDLKVVSYSEILKASLLMKEKSLARNVNLEPLTQLRESTISILKSIDNLKNEYKKLKKENGLKSKKLKQQFLKQIEQKQLEFQDCMKLWKKTYMELRLSPSF